MVTKKKKLGLFTSMLLSAAVLAGSSITIDASSAPYSSAPAIQGVNYQSETAVIEAGMSQAVGLYRTKNGTNSAPVGTDVTVTWQDKSSSKGTVVNMSSDAAMNPATLTSSPPAGGGGGGSGDPGSGGGSTGGGGDIPGPGGCIGKCGKVTVGPPKQV